MITTKTLATLALESYDHHTYEDKDMDAQALVMVKDGCTVIAIRGTESLFDVLTDMRFFPWRDRIIGQWCVAGFLKYTRPLIKQIVPSLSGPIYVTGHSLGGAAASIFAAHCHVMGLEVAGLVTFGEPRPGFAGLGKIVNQIPGYRFAIDGDPVDDIPPFSPLSPFFYSHGREVRTLPGRVGLDHPMRGYHAAVPVIKL